MKPILKWAGGKSQLTKIIIDKIKNIEHFTRYYEPFLGGGAVLFQLEPKNALINDYNSELINLYERVKQSPRKVIKYLYDLQNGSTEEKYYDVRNWDKRKWPIRNKNQWQQEQYI
jgi:DNA adenine methylase